MLLTELIEEAKGLSAIEKIRLIEALMPILEQDISTKKDGDNPLKSYYGVAKNLGTSPSDEDIAEMRREVFKNFPREDIV